MAATVCACLRGGLRPILPSCRSCSLDRSTSCAHKRSNTDDAERLLRNLARRLEQEAPGVAASILEGLDEMLTVNRLRLPTQLRRSLACTNSIENMMGTMRRVCRNVKRWRNADKALRWTTAGMMEATKGFRRLKAHSSYQYSKPRWLLIRPSTRPNRNLSKT